MELPPAISPNHPLDDPSPTYDEQLGLTFTQSFTSMAYNVTAVAQVDSDGYGPGYLLNGLTDQGYWYQVGLTWNWPDTSGFNMLYEVFDSSGHSIYPASGGGGVQSFSGTVNQGDTVLLNLYFSGGNVVMLAYDYSTGAGAEQTFSQEGSSSFVGLASSASNSKGFFTGLMTEWYHSSAYYGGEATVKYWENDLPKSSAWMWIDEYVPGTSQVLFSVSTGVVSYTNPNTLQFFSSNGATEASDAYLFITGGYNLDRVTVSYSVQGGGSGYSPPSFTYTFGGIRYSIQLSTAPSTIYLDSGSSWSADGVLSGSTSNEIWDTQQQTSGTPTNGMRLSFVYFHQFRASFLYGVANGGTGYSQPSVSVSEFGSPAYITLGSSVFVDAGSSYSFQNPLPGSSGNERWATQSATGVVGSSASFSVTYYHQFAISIGYVVMGGGNPNSPVLSGTAFGASAASPMAATPSPDWLDAGTSFSMPNTLQGSSSSERWYTNSSSSGSVNAALSMTSVYYHQYTLVYSYSVSGGGSPGLLGLNFSSLGSPSTSILGVTQGTAWADSGSTFSYDGAAYASSNERWSVLAQATTGSVSSAVVLSPLYYHQYYVQILPNPEQSGLVSPQTDWYNSSEQIQLSANPNEGWQFVVWNASGIGSYDGTGNPYTITVQDPIIESAVFYPGLSVDTSSFGSVSYGSSSLTGRVESSTNKTLFVPLGSTVQLTASPELFLFKFDGWSGATSSGQTGVSIAVNSPESLQASFSIDWINTSILIAIILVAVGIVLWKVVLPRQSKGKHDQVPIESPKTS